MDTTSKNARIAGFIYVLLAIVAPLRIMYIPSTLFVKGDATATAANIAAHESLFRLGIASDLLTGLLGLAVGLALYRLFKEVDRDLARLMVILGPLMVTPIYFLNALNDTAALTLVTGADYLSVFTKVQLDALAMLFLRLHHYGIVVNEVFWGLWLLPFGILIWKSRFLPKFLGVLLILNGIAYVAQAVTGVMFPAIEDRQSSLLFPVLMGEVVTMLWLLIMGAKPRAPQPA